LRAGVNREEVNQGAAELGVPLDDHIAFVIQALRPPRRARSASARRRRWGERFPATATPAPAVRDQLTLALDRASRGAADRRQPPRASPRQARVP